MIKSSATKTPMTISHKALFFAESIWIKDSDQDMLVIISMMFAKTSVVKAKERASDSPLLRCSAKIKTAKTTANTLSPCKKLKRKAFLLNKDSFRLRGGLLIIFFSSRQASKTVEHAGSMINSKKAICAGSSAIGHLNKTGNNAMPAIGTCTAKI